MPNLNEQPSRAIIKIGPSGDDFLENHESLSDLDRNFYFAMKNNGFLWHNGRWEFDEPTTKRLASEFTGQRVSFSGPAGLTTDTYFTPLNLEPIRFETAFKQPAVAAVIKKFREKNERQAARTAFILGGLIRHTVPGNSSAIKELDDVVKVVNFVANMTQLGDLRSADAIASAMVMYVASGGEVDETDKVFKGRVYRMAEAVSNDPVKPTETKDLGLSQVARWRTYLHKLQGKEQSQPIPDISDHEQAFEGFPTVGAEFHFLPEYVEDIQNLWKKLAIANMAQYQKDSYIQLSRNDRGIIEMRMNPSTYPVAIANWLHMTLLFPELRQTFFTSTINRSKKKADFDGKDEDHEKIVHHLRALGLLSYAALYNKIPRADSEEVNFGTSYLGQTVRVNDGKYEFSGQWTGENKGFGQLALYTGYGDNFSHLAFYTSMGLVQPEILVKSGRGLIKRTNTLFDALSVDSIDRLAFFNSLQANIESDLRLNNAVKAGERIINLLRP